MATETDKDPGLVRVKRAIVSVTDKSGLADFVLGLKELNIEIVSTGGTANKLREAGIEAREISSLTQLPEMMDGRVKTLTHRVHGGLLAIRGNADHVQAMARYGISAIDMAVVNFYRFEETAASRKSLTEVIEQIDIGGPAMVRSAAKNYQYVAAVISPTQYGPVLREMRDNRGCLSLQTRYNLAEHAFWATHMYDQSISRFLSLNRCNAEAREILAR